MILFALIVIWPLLIAFVVALCRIAAAADRNYAATRRNPVLSVHGPRAKLPGRIRWGGPRASAPRARRGAGTGGASAGGVRGGRGRAGRYAAGS
jgi:hypothetical protein